jgi:ADP-heptose:LPS heptosyltransferase
MDPLFDGIRFGPFSDLPRKEPKEEYDAAVELLVSHWNSLPRRPTAIYQVGRVGAPGFSDLDFVLTFPDGRLVDWRQFQPQTFPPWVRRLMTHPPYCCAESVWPDLLSWYPTFDVRWLWGSTLPTPEIPAHLIAGCALGMLVDYLFVKMPRDILRLAWGRPLRLRTLLCQLHSFQYTAALAEKVGFMPSPEAVKAIRAVESLRANWFTLEENPRLELLVQACAEICEETGKLISRIDTKLLSCIDGPPEIPGRGGPNPARSLLFTFISPWSFEEAIRSAAASYAPSRRVSWSNPPSFALIPAIYQDECPRLKEHLRAQGFNLTQRWEGGIWNEGLRYHARAMMAYSHSAARIGIPPQKYVALGYSPPLPLRLSLQRAVVRTFRGELKFPEAIPIPARTAALSVLKWLTGPAAALLFCEPVFRLVGRRPKLRQNKLQAAKRILVIRVDEIGDVVLTTPFLRELRRNAPQAWITLVVNPQLFNLVEMCPYVNEVLTFDRRVGGPTPLRRHARRHARALRLAATRLWWRRFDIAIIPRWGPDFYHATYLAYFSGALRRVGYSEGVCAAKREKNAGFDTMLTDVLTDGSAKHAVEHNLNVVRFLGGELADARLEVWLDEEDRSFAAEVFARHGVEGDEPIFTMAPGAGAPRRRWPIERFVELGRLLLREYNPKLVIVGGAEDRDLGERLEAELGRSVINLAGRTTLRQAAAVLQRCRLTVSNDSGPMHLAAAAGSAVVELSCHPIGGVEMHVNSPVAFRPWGVSQAVVQPEQARTPCRDACEWNQPHCILGVSVEQALHAVRLLLAANSLDDSVRQ